jgi:hypothetical protein
MQIIDNLGHISRCASCASRSHVPFTSLPALWLGGDFSFHLPTSAFRFRFRFRSALCAMRYASLLFNFSTFTRRLFGGF